MSKSKKNDKLLQKLAQFAKAILHFARLAVLKYLGDTKFCISGYISDFLLLSFTIVFKHLKKLYDLGLIKSKIDSNLRINYYLCRLSIYKYFYFKMFEYFFVSIRLIELNNNYLKLNRKNN